MRVIAGIKRGTLLATLQGDAIRPTSDKVKGAIFSSLQNDLRKANVFVDLFGGTGAMGIEALSRGVKKAYYFDIAKPSIEIIKKNIQKTAFQSQSIVQQQSAKEGINYLYQNNEICDIIFMDPPYKKSLDTLFLVQQIIEKKILSKTGKIVIEHDKQTPFPKTIDSMIQYKEKNYGRICISYYCQKEEDSE